MKTFFAILAKNKISFRGYLLLYAALALILSAAVVAMSYLTGQMSEAAIYFNVDDLTRFMLLLTAAFVLRAIASALTTFMLVRFNATAGYTFRQNFARYFLHVPFKKFEATGSGPGLSLYSNDLPQAAGFVADGGLNMISDVISLIVSIGFMLTLNVPFTLLFVALFPILIFMQVKISAPIQARAIQTMQATATFNAVVSDALQNTSTIIAYSLEDAVEERYLTSYDKFMDALRGQIRAMLPLVMTGIIASFLPLILLIILSSNAVIGGNMSIAEYMALTGIAAVVSGWLQMLSQRLNMFQRMQAGAKRLLENTAEPVDELHTGATPTTAAIDIRFDDVNFAYTDADDAPLALNNVSFTIPHGKRVAFVGASGSGKSTVLKLMMGLYTPQSGTISLGGTYSTALSLASLRQIFAYVPQDSFLFPESIGTNIAAGLDVDKAQLEQAAAQAGILDFINSLPQGFDGVLAESADNVSGGQRQRIALARAFYRNAPVILFDEATSALDPITEAAILETLNEAAAGKTVVMVAHRTRAIAACDTIVYLESGKVAAIGSHTELLTHNAAYRNLYETQEQKEQEQNEIAGVAQ